MELSQFYTLLFSNPLDCSSHKPTEPSSPCHPACDTIVSHPPAFSHSPCSLARLFTYSTSPTTADRFSTMASAGAVSSLYSVLPSPSWEVLEATKLRRQNSEAGRERMAEAPERGGKDGGWRMRRDVSCSAVIHRWKRNDGEIKIHPVVCWLDVHEPDAWMISAPPIAPTFQTASMRLLASPPSLTFQILSLSLTLYSLFRSLSEIVPSSPSHCITAHCFFPLSFSAHPCFLSLSRTMHSSLPLPLTHHTCLPSSASIFQCNSRFPFLSLSPCMFAFLAISRPPCMSHFIPPSLSVTMHSFLPLSLSYQTNLSSLSPSLATHSLLPQPRSLSSRTPFHPIPHHALRSAP